MRPIPTNLETAPPSVPTHRRDVRVATPALQSATGRHVQDDHGVAVKRVAASPGVLLSLIRLSVPSPVGWCACRAAMTILIDRCCRLLG